VECGAVRRRDALQRQDAAEPESAEHRQVQPADRARDVLERAGARVAVVAGVGQRAGPARVGDDDERPPPHDRGARSFSDRATGANVCRSTREKTFGGANASTMTSAPSP
jgi:hypothetical protein